MTDLPQFQEKVMIYRKRQVDPQTGKPYTQQTLARAIGLSADELGHRLRGTGRTPLTQENAFAIVCQLAEWGALTWDEAVGLLTFMGYPLNSPDWQTKLQRYLAPPVQSVQYTVINGKAPQQTPTTHVEQQQESILDARTTHADGSSYIPSSSTESQGVAEHTGRRLIEDLFPIRAVSSEAVREKSRRHGHISTLHLWWTRRPLVVARAAVYGALVPAPTNDKERKISKDLMKELCRWDCRQDILKRARLDILAANNERPPYVLDMFAGGGSIPLEALRLGCETYAGDLNPLAYIIELCTLDYPQRYGSSLVADVKRWGTWIIERAKEQLAEFYPPLTSGAFPKDGGQQRSFANGMNAINAEGPLTPVAYLWTRTVCCPNSICGAIVPLVRQIWLRKRGNYCIALRACSDRTTKSMHFEVVQASEVGKLGFDPGTDNKRHHVYCLHCEASVDFEYIKTQGQDGHIGQRLMAIVYTQQVSPEKIYVADKDIPHHIDQEKLLARIDALCDEYELSLPVEPVSQHLTGGMSFGLTRFKDLFAPRQLLSLLAFTGEVRRAYHAMLDDGMQPERAAAITTYLGVMINRLADQNSSVCRWNPARQASSQTYTRAALSMAWDFAEINPCTEGPGSPTHALNWITSVIQELVQSGRPAHVKRASALQLPFRDKTFDAIITDPPYYSNPSYIDLSDFFYVWLKRSIGFVYPDHLLRSSLALKKEEAITMANYRDQSAKDAKQNYERMMVQAFVEAYRALKPRASLSQMIRKHFPPASSSLRDEVRVKLLTLPLPKHVRSRPRGTAIGDGGVRPLTDERVAWKGPSGER